MHLKGHSLDKNLVLVGVVPIDGLVSFSGDRNEDEFTAESGINGGRQSESNNETGTITITVNQHAKCHLALTALRISKVPFDIALVDKTSNATAPAVVSGSDCRFMRPPPFEREVAQTDVVYTFSVVTYNSGMSGAGEA